MSLYLGIDSQISSPRHEWGTGNEVSSQGACPCPYLCIYRTPNHTNCGPASERPLAKGVPIAMRRWRKNPKALLNYTLRFCNHCWNSILYCWEPRKMNPYKPSTSFCWCTFQQEEGSPRVHRYMTAIVSLACPISYLAITHSKDVSLSWWFPHFFCRGPKSANK